jgi:hypothetical protein
MEVKALLPPCIIADAVIFVLSGPIVIHTNGTATVTGESDIPVKLSGQNFLRLSVSRK